MNIELHVGWSDALIRVMLIVYNVCVSEHVPDSVKGNDRTATLWITDHYVSAPHSIRPHVVSEVELSFLHCCSFSRFLLDLRHHDSDATDDFYRVL